MSELPMNARTILRIGIYLLGLWTLYSGVSTAVYYVYARATEAPSAFPVFGSGGAAVFGNAVVPLLFSAICIGFGDRIARALLGRDGEQETSGTPMPTVLRACVKMLALYLLAISAGPTLATIFELIAVRSGNRSFSDMQVVSDLMSNGVSIAVSLWLAPRTESAIRLLFGKRG